MADVEETCVSRIECSAASFHQTAVTREGGFNSSAYHLHSLLGTWSDYWRAWDWSCDGHTGSGKRRYVEKMGETHECVMRWKRNFIVVTIPNLPLTSIPLGSSHIRLLRWHRNCDQRSSPRGNMYIRSQPPRTRMLTLIVQLKRILYIFLIFPFDAAQPLRWSLLLLFRDTCLPTVLHIVIIEDLGIPAKKNQPSQPLIFSHVV